MPTFIKPKKLTPGDQIAVLSPSWGGPSIFPHVFDHGLKILREDFGLTIKEFPTTRAENDYLYHNPAARAADVNAAFADPAVKAIIASIGGDDSVRILPYLEPDLIAANPKILLGYSDATTLLTTCNQLGLITFNGPAVMAGFSQLRALPTTFADHIRTLLFDGPETYDYQPYEHYTERYAEWADPANVGLIGPTQPNTEKWQWLVGDGIGQGVLFGGCIEVLEFMKGTKFWPPSDFWQGKILFFETSEDKPSPTQVKYFLRNYGSQGILDTIRGILFGRARGYAAEEKQELYQALVSVVAVEFGRPDLPIVANMDFGHTDPQLIMPLGVRAEIDCREQTVRLLERVVE